MNKIIITLALVFIGILATAQETYDLTVQINNATSDRGTMVFSLSTKDTFMTATPYRTGKGVIKDGTTTVVFKDVPAGAYAVIALHDLNGNNRMDFDLNGMPQESYGASNNAMSYGPPEWTTASFDLDKSMNLTIRL